MGGLSVKFKPQGRNDFENCIKTWNPFAYPPGYI